MLDISLGLVQAIIQGGAVGLMLVSIVLGYKLVRMAIDRGFDFVSNHLAHNTEAVKEGTETTKEVVLEIRRMSDKLDRGD